MANTCSKRKLLLISVGRLPWYRKGERLFFFYTPRLGLPSLAAVTPSDWEVTILDGVQADTVDLQMDVDLVGFSILTPFAVDSYKLADRFRKQGIPVVLGGVHPTLQPEEAKAHADAVVIGEGEPVWIQILEDCISGTLQPFYEAVDKPVMESLPLPDFGAIQNRDAYPVANAFQLVRGCPHGASCPFCIVPKLFGTRYRVLPPAEAVARIRAQQEEQGNCGINVSACCPLNYTAYILEFADAVTPLGIEWCGAALLERLNDPGLIERLGKAGCSCIYTESEVVSARKNPVRYEACRQAALRLHEAGIAISYNFTVGFDDDDDRFVEDVLEFISDTGIPKELCAIQRFAPWPGTAAFAAMEKEGRILHRDWARYDNTQVVHIPKKMSVETFEKALQGG